MPSSVRKVLGRAPHNVPERQIKAFTTFGLEYALRRKRATTPAEHINVDLWAGERFCQLVTHAGLGEGSGVYVFNSAGLEILQFAQARGLFTVLEQTIAPRLIQTQLLKHELERYPDWEPSGHIPSNASMFAEREQKEWDMADLIICGSEFVRDGIQACGGPIQKCAVIPYGVDTGVSEIPRRVIGGPLRVLVVGEVGLRKGAPYVMQAATRLQKQVHVRMVGQIAVSQKAETKLREVVELVGPVPRTEILKHFAWADVFLLPSMCEGSATVVYEALGVGLPIICTPNTGSVVRDGVEGYIVPVRDVDAIVESLRKLIDESHRQEVAGNAMQRSREFSLEHYGSRLITAINSFSLKGHSLQDPPRVGT
jgi:glycosyltransferase involved in cell wall biosynthesis